MFISLQMLRPNGMSTDHGMRGTKRLSWHVCIGHYDGCGAKVFCCVPLFHVYCGPSPGRRLTNRDGSPVQP